MKHGITIQTGLLWVLAWLGFMVLYTLLDIAVWRRLVPAYSKYLNIISVALCMAAFLALLSEKNDYRIDIFKNISWNGILLAAGCAALFYFLLDRGLDPVFARLFPASEEKYREALSSLSSAPVAALLQVCVLAPLLEEILMRDFLLGGLSANYGKPAALLISSLLFALLHFNMAQTLSALICGILLGLLYLHTDSLFCCIAAHSGYNLISFFTTIMPLCRKQ
ncbi:MAG: CPBP family intramembrane metalloprotease [Lachnospiraceae bacterium]|nr:CPBP family intramembrane metalloprotease [Lachnospiraceae bacterium]